MGSHIINPVTGRLVLKKGAIGKAIIAAKKKKQTKNTAFLRSKCTKQKKCGPVSGKYYGHKNATKFKSPVVKRAGKTKNYATRPSARYCFNRGECGPVCYGGSIHIMAFRNNGSPYWKKV